MQQPTANHARTPAKPARHYSEWGKRVRAALILADCSVKELAPQIEISTKSLLRSINGDRPPKPQETSKIARALGMPESFFDVSLGAVVATDATIAAALLRAIHELRQALDESEALLHGLAPATPNSAGREADMTSHRPEDEEVDNMGVGLPEPVLLKVYEVARWLRVSEDTVLHYWREGLPGFRLSNGRGPLRFRPDDVLEWLRERGSAQT
jgi:transcriptional regulator with XRE-family HTH domain